MTKHFLEADFIYYVWGGGGGGGLKNATFPNVLGFFVENEKSQTMHKITKQLIIYNRNTISHFRLGENCMPGLK